MSVTDTQVESNQRQDTTRHQGCWHRRRTTLEQILLALLVAMSALCAVLVVLLARRQGPESGAILQDVSSSDERLGRAAGRQAPPINTDSESHSSDPCVGDCGNSPSSPPARADMESEPCVEDCDNTTPSSRPAVCTSQHCVQAAASLLQNMDQTADPCVDFYQFACGRWPTHHALPPDRSHYDTFSQMKDELKSALKELLERPVDETDSRATANAKHLYRSCMNESVLESRREEPLVRFLSHLGGWPVVTSNWTGEGFDWVRMVAFMRQLNNDILFGQWVGPDQVNSSIHLIQLDQAELGLPSRDYYLGQQEAPQIQAYLRIMVDVAVLLGAHQDNAQQEMNDVLQFETNLANITIPSEERRNYTAIYRRITLRELREEVPQVNWTEYFQLVMPMGIDDSEEIVVYALGFLKGMVKLIRETPKRVVANYILWRFVYNRVSNLDSRFLAKQQDYFRALYGTQMTPPRWKTCTVYVNKNMGMAVGALFVKARFNHGSKQKALEMIADIKEAFLQILDEVRWMDNRTLEMARIKAETMSQKIGYPEYIQNAEDLDKDYSGVDFSPDTYFENVISSLRHHTTKELMKLRTPVDKSQWVTSPAVVNAFYTRSKNFITVPAGMLQPPLYHQYYPRSLNYGGIGVVIGHEITHGFDDKGRQFDELGNLKQWWNAQSLARFQQEAQCMIDQYGRYVLPDINMRVNGINTQGENIADNGGVKQAFRAYKNWEQHNGQEAVLPGLNLTHHQLFFLNYAQIWCGVMRPEAAASTIKTGAHSPGNFRVIGVISNSKDFSEAYNCHLGSPMNPESKCVVW